MIRSGKTQQVAVDWLDMRMGFEQGFIVTEWTNPRAWWEHVEDDRRRRREQLGELVDARLAQSITGTAFHSCLTEKSTSKVTDGHRGATTVGE